MESACFVSPIDIPNKMTIVYGLIRECGNGVRAFLIF